MSQEIPDPQHALGSQMGTRVTKNQEKLAGENV
jgi:hypothetical protein